MPFRAPTHKPFKRVARHTPPTPNRQARRALATNSAEWRRIRKRHLAREPKCRECAKEGYVTNAREVDHIDGDSTNNPVDGSNYQSLCRSCHSRKTARENGGFGNERRAPAGTAGGRWVES